MALRFSSRPRLRGLLPLHCGVLLAPVVLADAALPTDQPQAVPKPAKALCLNRYVALSLVDLAHDKARLKGP